MRNCKHLKVETPHEIRPGVWSKSTAFCDLKDDAPTAAQMAIDATQILGRRCLLNTECHYYASDECEKCPDYAP